MSNNKPVGLMDQLRRVVDPLALTLNDEDLLGRFLESRDEAAFAALLHRHGPMVLGVGRRLLHHAQDAEDVVQATFLLLVRKGATIRKHASLGSWLHGAAHRLSLQLKKRDMNRRTREKHVVTRRQRSSDSRELCELLDTALQGVSEKYRAALILCYLEGRTQEQAAQHLQIPIGTLQSRLTRGRRQLSRYLSSHGWTLSTSGVATLLIAETAPAALPSEFIGASLQAARSCASGQSLHGLVSASVTFLVDSGLRSLAVSKLAWASVAVMTLVVLAGGAGLVALESPQGTEVTPKAAGAKGEKKEPEVSKPRVDRYGDALPEGALARLGTVRFRQGGTIHELAFSSDGKTLMAADGGSVHFWDAATGKLVRRIGDHQGDLFSPSASLTAATTIALRTRDGTVDVIDTKTDRVIHRHAFGSYPLISSLSPDGKLLAVYVNVRKQGDDDRIALVDATTGAEVHRLNGHEDRIHCMVFTADSKTLVTSSDDKSIRFWDVATGKKTSQLNHTSHVGKVTLSPDGKYLASLKMEKNEYKTDAGISTTWLSSAPVSIWNLQTKKVTRELQHRLQPEEGNPRFGSLVWDLTFSRDGKHLIACGAHGVYFWNLESGKELLDRRIPETWATAIAFAPDGNTLAVGGDGSVRLWDSPSGKEKLPLDGHRQGVQTIAVSPDGKSVATSGGQNQIFLWNLATAKIERGLAGAPDQVAHVAFEHAGRFIVAAAYDGPITIADGATGNVIHRITGSLAAISPDSKLLLTQQPLKADGSLFVSGDGAKAQTKTKYRVFEIATVKELGSWSSAPSHGPWTFSPDGKSVYSWDTDQKVRVRDARSGALIRFFEGNVLRANSKSEDDNRIFCTTFSADGTLAALGNQDGEIAIFDVTTGAQLKLLHTRRGSLTALAFSADNRHLACGHWEDKDAHIWELASGQESRSLAGHSGRILSLAFTPDSKQLISGSTDTTVLVWDLTGTLTGPTRKLLSPNDLEMAWGDLAAPDALRGQKAVRTLLAVPDQALSVLSQKVKPASLPSAEKMAQLISDLDSDTFGVRERARGDLEDLGDAAAPQVKRALEGKLSLEHKARLENLLKTYANAKMLWTIRVIHVLEMIGTDSSRAFLTRLAGGVPAALITREAHLSMERVEKRRIAKQE